MRYQTKDFFNKYKNKNNEEVYSKKKKKNIFFKTTQNSIITLYAIYLGAL